MNKVASIALLLVNVFGVSHVVEAQKMTDVSKHDVASAPTAAIPGQFHEVPFGEPVNPDRCKSGKKGYIYWAAREHVFAFRFDPTKPVYPRSGNPNVVTDVFIPPAPDPTEPEGCYGNPLRGSDMPYMWDHSAQLFEKMAGRRIQTDGMHSFVAIRDQLQLRDDGNELNRKMFFKGKDCQLRKSGMMECQISVGQPEEYNTQVFKIESKLLFNDLKEGHDIYALIHADTASHVFWKNSKAPSGELQNGKALESTINLYSAVRLRDSFRLFPHEVDLLIPYYRSMIRYIADAHVSNYSWTPIKATK